MSPKPTTKSRPRLRASCDGCFLAKVKCSKARPVCSRCLTVGLVCRYSPSGLPRAAARAVPDALRPATLSDESCAELGEWLRLRSAALQAQASDVVSPSPTTTTTTTTVSCPSSSIAAAASSSSPVAASMPGGPLPPQQIHQCQCQCQQPAPRPPLRHLPPHQHQHQHQQHMPGGPPMSPGDVGPHPAVPGPSYTSRPSPRHLSLSPGGQEDTAMGIYEASPPPPTYTTGTPCPWFSSASSSSNFYSTPAASSSPSSISSDILPNPGPVSPEASTGGSSDLIQLLTRQQQQQQSDHSWSVSPASYAPDASIVDSSGAESPWQMLLSPTESFYDLPASMTAAYWSQASRRADGLAPCCVYPHHHNQGAAAAAPAFHDMHDLHAGSGGLSCNMADPSPLDHFGAEIRW